MKRGFITEEEIKEAIRQTKGNRVPGEDKLTTSMLKADPAARVRALEGFLNKV